MAFDLKRRCMVEALGTAFLVAAIVGSGIMADRLTSDPALTLLCNALATAAILSVLITILGPLSGAHLNPAVTLAFLWRREITTREAFAYGIAQTIGGIVGGGVAHAMFALPALQFSTTVRMGAGLWIAEVVASFGLVLTIVLGKHFRPGSIALLVGFYILSAYWFTASTSFANPAVVIARVFSDTFAGIRLEDAPAFIVAQLIGTILAITFLNWLLSPERNAVKAFGE